MFEVGSGFIQVLSGALSHAQEVAGTSVPEAIAPVVAKIDSGDTAWMLVSTALVLLMTPGLAFFYAGMTRTKNVASTLFQNIAALGVIGVLWGAIGYSLAFDDSGSAIIGGLKHLFARGVDSIPNEAYAKTIPHSVFMLFQAMFAVITPVLISGAIAERVKFNGYMVFIALWSLLVYAPVAHWVWGVGGFLRDLGALDFAGGMVVHMTAGFSGITAALLLKNRSDFGKKEIKMYDAGYVVLGTALLWFGWFGFNAGSALAADGIAANAFGTTFFASASAFVAWMIVDLFRRGKPSLVGCSVAAVAGLVTITPAAGFVSFSSAILIGIICGVVCNYAVSIVKEHFKLDDSLDVFACHGVGGLLGTILTGVFCSKAVNPAGNDGVIFGNFSVLKANLIGSAATIAVSVIATIVIFKIVDAVIGMRVSAADENLGLDQSQHDEYINSNFVGTDSQKNAKAV